MTTASIPAATGVAKSTVICSYVLCFLMPLAGFFAGIYLMTKKESGHGTACLGISIAVMLALLALFSQF